MQSAFYRASALRKYDQVGSLIELTLVIMVVLAFATATLFFAGNIKDWRKGKVASESLRSVYAAQRGFLADKDEPGQMTSLLPPAPVYSRSADFQARLASSPVMRAR